MEKCRNLIGILLIQFPKGFISHINWSVISHFHYTVMFFQCFNCLKQSLRFLALCLRFKHKVNSIHKHNNVISSAITYYTTKICCTSVVICSFYKRIFNFSTTSLPPEYDYPPSEDEVSLLPLPHE